MNLSFVYNSFADKLYTSPPGENETSLPSPESLQERILVKVL